MNAEFWIIRPFNALFCACFAVFILLLTVASLVLSNKDERVRRRVLVIASLVTLVGFFVYKGFLSVDGEFAAANREMGGFNWWGELPLQLCNINMIMIPIAVLWNKRPLMGFCFFVGSLGAIMALAMPSNGFDGYSLLLPRMLGFYGTHFAIVIEAIALVSFGLYKPRLRDLPLIIVALIGITLVIFGVNMLLRVTGLHSKANYFFSVESEGNPLLSIFYRWLPVPFLYLILPCSVILLVYMMLVMGLLYAPGWIAKKVKSHA